MSRNNFTFNKGIIINGLYRGPTGKILDLDFLLKKAAIFPKSREKFSIFPIPNFPPRHPVEYFVFESPL